MQKPIRPKLVHIENDTKQTRNIEKLNNLKKREQERKRKNKPSKKKFATGSFKTIEFCANQENCTRKKAEKKKKEAQQTRQTTKKNGIKLHNSRSI